ncbi:MAG: metallophosphoesterase [Spirochaetales bacterium]|nr:metallophosphoesterase [Spirochaetales bacterium]
MKILCVADHVDPLVYSNQIKQRFKDIDLVLGAGDLNLEYYGFIVSSLNKPLGFVFGNHNLDHIHFYRKEYAPSFILPDVTRNTFGSVYLGARHWRVKGLLIAGLGGSRKYNNGPNQFTEYGMFMWMLKLIPGLLWNRLRYKRYLDILVTHASPYGIHDKEDACHRGFKVFLKFMDIFKPRYLIHGHIHLYDLNAKRSTRYRETIVINAYDHCIIDTEERKEMDEYVNQLAHDDFNKAKTKSALVKILNTLTPERQELLSLQDVKDLVKPKSESYIGMETVKLDRIIGSEGRYNDFNRAFLPKKEFIRHRWESVDKAHIKDVILPPVKLYKISEVYFVRDGNHRVSVAKMNGQYAIDAEVIELNSKIHIDPGMTMQDLKKKVIEYEKELVFSNSDLGKIFSEDELDFTETGRYHEVLRHIQGHKYFLNLDKKEEIPFIQAGKSWYENYYLPIIEYIKKEGVIARFPGRTESDLYVWILKHWHHLKNKYGNDYPLEKAVRHYSKNYGKSLWTIFTEWCYRLFHYLKH